MASIDLASSVGNAAVAYQDALNQARNTQNALLRQYGFTFPGADGQYTVEGAQTAFDPNTLFDRATGGINQARLQELTANLRTGPTGVFGDISRGGATAEAEAVMGARAAGLGGGGLAAQRRALAETQTAQQFATAKQQALTGLGEAMAPIGGAFQRLQIAQAEAKAQEEAAKATAGTIPQQNLAELFAPEVSTGEVTQGGGKPDRAGTKMYELKGGFRWMGAKKGWQPVGGTPKGKEGVKPKPVPRPAPRPAPAPPKPAPRPAPAPPKPAPKPAPKKKK